MNAGTGAGWLRVSGVLSGLLIACARAPSAAAPSPPKQVVDAPAASESSANADVAPRSIDTQPSDAGEQSQDAGEQSEDAGEQSEDAGEQSEDAGEQSVEPPDRAPPKDSGIAWSLEQARGRYAVMAIRAPVPFNDTLLPPQSTAFIRAYTERGAGVQIKCARNARIVVDLLDDSGKPVPLHDPGARRVRTPSSADLFAPQLHRSHFFFFVRIKNEARQATTCDVLVSALVFGP